MKRLVLLLCFALTLSVPPTLRAWRLDSHTEDTIRAASFEFIAPSDERDRESLVGSAFAIGPNEFVTAAHLLNAAIGSHFGHPELMDSRRVAYRIADILEYSEQQDYVVFSLEHPPMVEPLPARINSVDVQSTLYFSGWQSDGSISIDRGTFSGLTPDVSKEFDWLRFSGRLWNRVAGGPLFDESGRVVGIVQARAKDGGPNYAVPIDLVRKNIPAVGRIHAMDMLRSLMPAVSSAEPLKADIPLPLSFSEFSRRLEQLRLEYFDRVIGPLLEATRDNFVLTGAGAEEACNLLNGEFCQCKGRAGLKGRIVSDIPHIDEQLSRIEKGEPVAAVLAGVTIVRTAERNNVSTHGTDLSRNSLLHLNLALKAQEAHLQSSRPISRRTRSPAEVYTDFHDRTWYLRSWPLEQQDFVMISLARAVPNGQVVLTRIVPTALGAAAVMQVKFVANIIYYGCEDLPSQGVALVAQQ